MKHTRLSKSWPDLKEWKRICSRRRTLTCFCSGRTGTGTCNWCRSCGSGSPWAARGEPGWLCARRSSRKVRGHPVRCLSAMWPRGTFHELVCPLTDLQKSRIQQNLHLLCRHFPCTVTTLTYSELMQRLNFYTTFFIFGKNEISQIKVRTVCLMSNYLQSHRLWQTIQFGRIVYQWPVPARWCNILLSSSSLYSIWSTCQWAAKEINCMIMKHHGLWMNQIFKESLYICIWK